MPLTATSKMTSYKSHPAVTALLLKAVDALLRTHPGRLERVWNVGVLHGHDAVSFKHKTNIAQCAEVK